MARLLTTGWETGALAAEPAPAVPAVQAGTPVIQSSRKRTGGFALQLQGGDHVRLAGMGTGTTVPYWHRSYWDFEAFPAALYTLMSRPSGYMARVTSGGVLGLYFGGTLIGTGIQLALDTQYLVELKSQINTAAGADDSGELWVDGVQIAAETNVARSTVVSGNFDLGQTAADASVEAYVDDIAVNDNTGSAQTGRPGPGAVLHAKPKADSAVGAAWEGPQTTGSDTTNLFDNVDNTPPQGVAHSDVDANAGKYAFQAAASATDLDLTMQDYDEVGVPAGATITLVQAFVRGGSSSSTLTAGAIDLVSNPDQGTETAIASWDLANVIAATEPTGWNTFTATTVYSPTVTRATDPVVRVGKRTAAARVVMADLVGIVIDYVPSTTTTVSGGVASEADAALAGTRKQIYTASPAAEADAGPVGKVLQRYTAAPASEADSAPAGVAALRQLIAGGRALEADTAPSGTVIQPQIVAGGRALEADSSPSGKVLQRYTAAPAAQADTAPIGKVLQRYTAPAASEADAAPAASVIQPQIILAGRALEADSAPAGQVRQIYLAGRALEADTATSGKVLQRYTAVPAAEGDSSPAGKVTQRYTAGPATEADSARAGTTIQPQLVAGGVGAEADSARGGTVQQGAQQTVAGGTAGEADSAPVGKVAQLYIAGRASEADAAIAGKVAQLYLGGRALEADTATGGKVAQLYLGGRALEVDSAAAGTIIQPQLVLAGTAAEANAALAGQILQAIRVIGGTAQEADRALAGYARVEAGEQYDWFESAIALDGGRGFESAIDLQPIGFD